MKHDTLIADEVLRQFAYSIGDMRYDKLCDFVKALAVKIDLDAANDIAAGREKLGQRLRDASTALYDAVDLIADAWDICESKMNNA